jgi:hypothetical protein
MTTTINASTSSGLVQTADTSGIIKVQSNGVATNALAWGNFYNASGTSVTTYSSFNVSSITATAAGDFTINFTNAMADVNYVVVGTGGTTTTGMCTFTNPRGATANTTTSFRAQALFANGSLVTTIVYMQFAVFGN